LDPKEKYKQSVEVAFKVTMAAIDAGSKDKARAVVKVKVDDDTYVLCTLVAGSVWQQPLDILFSEGDEIEFFAEGAKVHLTGYFVDMGGDDDDDMSDEEDGMSGEEGDSGSDVDDEDIPPELLAKLRKQAELEGSDDSEEEAVIMKALGDKKRKNDAPPKEDTKKAKPEVKKEDTKKLQLKGGVVATDITVGKGPEAVKGKKVGMRYVGKLYVNGKPTKQFDANTNGKPFAFKLGVGEVIQGWDVGVQGMKVGGERELVIPAAMGYGKRGAPPDIPPNATLHFSVKLVDVRK
jgi:FK506-binding nuclear protein